MVTVDEATDAISRLSGIGSPITVEFIPVGSNDSFLIETDAGRYVAKFNTFSQYDEFCSEVRVLTYLNESHFLPVPELIVAETERRSSPLPFFVTRYIDGQKPTALSETYQPRLVRQMGFIILSLGYISPNEVTGYGRITADDEDGLLVAEHDSWRDYYQQYLYHILDTAEWTAPSFLQEYIDPLRTAIEAGLSAVPEHPDYAIVLPDFRTDNILLGETDDVVGVLDVERADIGDPDWMLANTHYLLSRGLDDPMSLRIQHDLSRGFSEWMPPEKEHVYRLGSLAKELRAFDYWWEEIPEAEYEQHADRMVDALTDTLDTDAHSSTP